MKKLLAILFSVLFFLPAAKGQNGEIYGTLTDSKGNPLSGVTIKVYFGDKYYGGDYSEKDGGYFVKPLNPGSYKVEYSLSGFIKRKTTGVIVTSASSVKLNYKMIKGSSDSEIIVAYKKPIVKCFLRTYKPSTLSYIPNHGQHPISLIDIENLTSLSSLAALRTNFILYPEIKPNYIYLSWSEQLKYNFNPRPNLLKQINKSYNENDLKYIPFQHLLETLPAFQR